VKIKKKKLFKTLSVLCYVALASACVGAGVSAAIRASAGKSYGDAFEYTQETPLKYQSYVSSSVSNQKGLLLFGYEKGGSAEFKGTFNGAFETEMYAVAQSGTAELRKYSLEFTDVATGKSFSVNIATGLDNSSCAVSVGGEKAGIAYFNNEWYKNHLCGYTAAYNAAGEYTKFSAKGITSIRFDPATQQVMVKGGGESYKLVWDFSKESNDGRVFKHALSSFGEYTVKVVFDEIKTSGKGELLIYKFGTYDFNSRFIEESLCVSADIKTKAVVGRTYDLPQARVSDLILGELPSADVDVTVYNDDGKIVNDGGVYSFTPTEAGNYYIYYAYNNDVTAYYLLEAINESDITSSFEYESNLALSEELGLHATAYIPAAKVESSLLTSAVAENALITIRRDGQVIDGYQNVLGGFTYSFDQYGEYVIEYTSQGLKGLVKEERTVRITKDVVGIVMDEIPEYLEFGSTLQIPSAKIYYNAEELTATPTLRYPSGKTTTNEEVTLDELGIYTLTQDWDTGSTEVSFSVNNTYASLFSDPTAVTHGQLKLNEEYAGQQVSLKNNIVLTYNKIIDLSDNVFDDTLADKTQNTPLVELIVQPNAIGQKDMTALYIEFVDVYDPTNFISVRVRHFDYNMTISRIRTKATGQGWVGYYYKFDTAELEVNDAPSHEDGGMITNASFTQVTTGREIENTILRLYFDNTENALYTRPDQETSHDGLNTPVPWLVRDYDTTDLKMGAGDTPWRGFTTGEVYMNIYALGVSDKANVAILNVDGNSFSNKYVTDSEAPSLTVDLGVSDSAPLAKVGTPYTIFGYTASDTYTGTYSDDPKVLLNGVEVPVQDGQFIPDREGTYTIVYTSYDYYGNATVQEIPVEARRTIAKPEIVKSASLPANAAYGQKLNIPAFNGIGGAGGVTTSVQVTCNGMPVVVEYGAFQCQQEGIYVIRYIVTDYVGNVTMATEYVTVKRSEKPVFDKSQVSLPPVFLVDEPYQLDEYVAYFYGGNATEEIVSKIELYDEASGEWKTIEKGDVYTPAYEDGGKVAKLRYSFEKDGKAEIYETEVPIVLVNVGYAGFMADYFTAENVELSCTDSLYFNVAEGESGTVKFVRAVDVKHLELMFAIKGEKFATAFDSFGVTLRDSKDPSLNVEFTVMHTKSGYWSYINNGERNAFGVKVEGDFSVIYDHKTSSFTDIYGYNLGKIETYKNGKVFQGFPSGSVYVEFTVSGAHKTPVALLQIANQNFNDTYYDYNRPLITLNGYVSGNYSVGDTIVLPTASVYDVFSYVDEVKVTVKCGGATIFRNLSASKEQSFTLDGFGTYQITYTAEDVDGNLATVNRFIVCSDQVRPSLEFDSEFITEAKSGDNFVLPNYTVKDNGDVTNVIVKAYLCTPDGIMHAIKGKSVTFTGAGTYVIYYQLIDENDNSAFYAFTVCVR